MKAKKGRQDKQGKRSFLSEMRLEFSRISWTERGELNVLARVVIAVIFVFGLGIYLADLGIRAVLVGLGNLIQVITGG